MDIEKIDLPEQHYIYVDRTATFSGDEIAKAMESGFGEVFGFCAQHGIEGLAMPMAVYMEMPTGDRMAFRAAVFVSAENAARAEGEVKAATMPAGQAFKTTHVGPYMTLNQTHTAMWDHMAAQGIEKAMPVWEIYVDDPTTKPEAEVRTEVYRALA
ncbi:MAG: GyrI-like domain-containing protein [Pseudomonadota bacterium]